MVIQKDVIVILSTIWVLWLKYAITWLKWQIILLICSIKYLSKIQLMEF